MRSAKATYAVLRAGSGEVGQRMLDDGYRLPINDASVVGQAIVHRRFQTAAGGRRTGDVEEGSTYLPLAQTELALPLIGGERALGAIAIQSALPNAFDQDDVTILQGIADSLAAALENARLFQQVQENLEEIRTLNRQYTLQAWGQGTPEQQGRSTYDNELVSAPGGQPATLNIPLMLRSQAIGSLTLESDQQTWAPEELAFIEAVTTQAVLALENARLLEETQQRAGHERIVAEIARSVRASTDVDTILRTSLTELSRALQATDGKIELLLDE
jgi:GAF domain-containing protein